MYITTGTSIHTVRLLSATGTSPVRNKWSVKKILQVENGQGRWLGMDLGLWTFFISFTNTSKLSKIDINFIVPSYFGGLSSSSGHTKHEKTTTLNPYVHTVCLPWADIQFHLCVCIKGVTIDILDVYRLARARSEQERRLKQILNSETFFNQISPTSIK